MIQTLPLDTLDKKHNADADYPRAVGLLIDALGERTPSTVLAFVFVQLAEIVDALEEDDETDDVATTAATLNEVQDTEQAPLSERGASPPQDEKGNAP